MEVNISSSPRESTFKTETNNKDFKKGKEKINFTISENYQAFLGAIFFIIGCLFLFYLFSFVFSNYVSHQKYN